MEVVSGNIECKVSAKRLWLCLFADAHNFLPKALSHTVSHITYEGTGFHAGGYRIIHAQKSHAEHLAKTIFQGHLVMHSKERLDEVDHQTLKIKFELVEGGSLGILVKSIKQSGHIVQGAIPNTCVLHWSFEYEALSKEQQLKAPQALKDWLTNVCKQVEEYLLSHDDYKEA